MNRRRAIQAGVSLAIGVLILYGILRVVHPGEVAAALRGASPAWIVMGTIAFLAFVVLRGWRWQLILGASAPATGFGDATAVTAMGFAVNAVSPFKLGEFVRIAAIAPRAGIGVGEAGATVIVERVLDVLALLVIALGATTVSGAGSHSSGLWSGVISLSLVSIAVALAAYVMVTYPDATLALLGRMARRMPRRVEVFADRFGASVLKGFTSLRSPGRLAAAAALSVLVWLAVVIGLVAFFRSLTAQLPLSTLVLACAIFVVSQAASITPAGVGAYEGFYLLVLSTFGARPLAVVTAAAVLSHVVNVAALLLAGAIGTLWLRVNRPALPVRLERPVPS